MAKRSTRTTQGTAGTSSTSATPRNQSTANDSTGSTTYAGSTDAEQSTESPLSDTRNESMGSEPSEEEIRMRAYRRYLERGGSDGRDFDDWLEAERELKGMK
jgi:hypothetical protein